MRKNNLSKLFTRKGKFQLGYVKSYTRGFVSSIKNYENMLVEDEIAQLIKTSKIVRE
ncbi:hypothetical protein [Chondrinema litorale]|uniref:hypothetical protein n=1 Tax=Chondrinema litorale TaxID=2994555 RepID=UPI002542A1C7|nr:hypothetical protein [Chondrinema litorale]UZR93544.1 hypothetical protein OQ292_16965 [Chondrinema litorale]